MAAATARSHIRSSTDATGTSLGHASAMPYRATMGIDVVMIREQCAWPSSSAAAATLATASIPEMPAGMSRAVYCAAASKMARTRREPAVGAATVGTTAVATAATTGIRAAGATAEPGESARAAVLGTTLRDDMAPEEDECEPVSGRARVERE